MINIIILCITIFISCSLYSDQISLPQTTNPVSHDTIRKKVDDIYKNISGYGLPAQEEELFKTKTLTMPSTYGEITWESLQQLIDYLNIKPNDVCYDLGSGVGKVVIQLYLTTPAQKVVGIELAPKRAQGAQQALSLLEKQKLGVPGKKVECLQANFLDVSLQDATIVYMCSTCFSKELMEQILQKLKKEAKPGLKVVTLKQLPDDPAFILEKQFNLPTSWSKSSPIYIYTYKTNHRIE